MILKDARRLADEHGVSAKDRIRLFGRLDTRMGRWLFEKQQVGQYKDAESIGAEFVAEMSEAIGDTVESPWVDMGRVPCCDLSGRLCFARPSLVFRAVFACVFVAAFSAANLPVWPQPSREINRKPGLLIE